MDSNVYVTCFHVRVAGSDEDQGPHKVKVMSPTAPVPGSVLYIHITKNCNSDSL